MNNITEIPSMLMFDGKPIRIVTFEDGGVPHFSLEDICEAVGWSKRQAADHVESILFPSHGWRTAEEVSAEGVSKVTVLTPVGVFYLTDLIDAGKGQRIAAWAKREARRLCPEARKDDPAMYLTLSAGKRRPPRPYKYSGWLAEWCALKEATLMDCRGAHAPMREIYEAKEAEMVAERHAYLEAQRAAASGKAQ